MTLTLVLAIAAVVTPATVALLIGYWHRKQMRQIEAFRADPSVGLVPPPSALWRFVTSNWHFLILVMPVVSTGLLFYANAPVTLLNVLVLSSNVATFLAVVVLHLLLRLNPVLESMIRLNQEMLGLTKDVVAKVFPPKDGAAA
jgi:hypothetical protein